MEQHDLQEWAQELFSCPSVDEVLINGLHGAQCLGVEASWCASPFTSEAEMIRTLQDLAFAQGQRLDPMHPAAGGLWQLARSHTELAIRWHALLPPIARDGPLCSLRRHRFEQLRCADFMATEDLQKLHLQLRPERPVLIIGPTGAGKTSLLIALLQAFAADERVAILEQVPEIPRLATSWIRVCAQAPDLRGSGGFSLSQVFDELLRLRPDRIVFGELRQSEVLAYRRSLLAGQGGIWCTLHTDRPERLAQRLGELSGDAETFWDQLLLQGEAVVMCMQRKRPRLSEAWVRSERGWETIFSAKEK